MLQNSVAVRNAKLNAQETAIGSSPIMRLYGSSLPVNCAAAQNTPMAQGVLPVDWLADAASGSKSKTGTWTLVGLAAAGAGTNITHYRIYDSTGTDCHEQGSVFQQISIATNAITASNGNVLNFASTTGVVVGMNVSGTNIIVGTTVLAVTGTTVTLSHSSPAGISSGASITFNGDMVLDNINVANSQAVTISSANYTAGNA